MEIDWDSIQLDDEFLDNEEFKRAVRNTLSMEWPPPEGLMPTMEIWEDNYNTWHAHLIPKESFFIPMDTAIKTYGLPYYTPVENPEKLELDINALLEIYEPSWAYTQLELNKQHLFTMKRDLKTRSDLIRKAKNPNDVRWYMILHVCQFNASVMSKIVKYLWPDENWKIIESQNHVLVTTGTKDEVLIYLRDGVYENPFYIADAVLTREHIANLMLKDFENWIIYDDMDEYEIKCYKEFFFKSF